MSNAVNFHDNIASDFDAKYRTKLDFQQRYAVWETLLKQYITPNADLLDAGCGSGVFSHLAASLSANVLGIDGAEAMIDLCKSRQKDTEKTTFRVGWIPNALAELPDASFDIIISSSVVEYIEDMDEVLQVFARLLRPNGYCIVSFPNKKGLLRRIESMRFSLTNKPEYRRYVHHVLSETDMITRFKSQNLSAVETQFYANPFVRFNIPTREFSSSLMVGVFKKI
jgi:2-polyprenyl-3-methyl-5-hydroxy-6-metoxy-1,4-benzoquinol methylase